MKPKIYAINIVVDDGVLEYTYTNYVLGTIGAAQTYAREHLRTLFLSDEEADDDDEPRATLHKSGPIEMAIADDGRTATMSVYPYRPIQVRDITTDKYVDYVLVPKETPNA